MTHPLIAQAQHQKPDVLSVYWNGQPILRIEQGETVLEQSVALSKGLLTIHFDDNPDPVYYAVV